jgi:spore germination cell wall hydrolase CwlJ-like protein
MASPAHAATDDRQRRCLTLVAYAEAANEGALGMLAVMRVIRNRMTHPLFAGDACGVALQRRQFQPVSENANLRRALLSPETASLATAANAQSPKERLRLIEAWRLAAVADVWPATDPTGGALYFVNPLLMDVDKCPWFARLKRTAHIGQHVFMTHYTPGERLGPPALNCSQVAARTSKTGGDIEP